MEHYENRTGRTMEEAIALGMRVHEQLEREQRALAKIAEAQRRMDNGFLPAGFRSARLPIDLPAARELVVRWKMLFPEMLNYFPDRVEPDYASIESRILSTMPEGVSPYGLPSSTQEEASSQQSGQKSGQTG